MKKLVFEARFIGLKTDMLGGTVALLAIEGGSVLHVGLNPADLADPMPTIQTAMTEYVKSQSYKMSTGTILQNTIISVEVDVPDDHSTDDPNVKPKSKGG